MKSGLSLTARFFLLIIIFGNYMKYKWLIIFCISFFLLTSCQSVQDFLQIGPKTQEQETEAETSSAAQVDSAVDELLTRLPDAKTIAERLVILQEAYNLAQTGQNADQTAYILQNLNADVASLSIAITPDYQQCEYGDSFNIMVFVDSPGIMSPKHWEQLYTYYIVKLGCDHGLYISNQAERDGGTLNRNLMLPLFLQLLKMLNFCHLIFYAASFLT